MPRLIDAEKLLNDIEKYHLSDGKFQYWVEVQNTVDAVEVVRCKDCIHSGQCTKEIIMRLRVNGTANLYCPMGDKGFCSHGERK